MELNLRNTKGSALSYTELDNNFTNLSSSISSNYTSLLSSIALVSSSANTGSYSGSYLGSLSGSLTGSLYVQGYSVFPYLSASLNFADDSSASSSGVPLGALYHTSGAIKIRLS